MALSGPAADVARALAARLDPDALRALGAHGAQARRARWAGDVGALFRTALRRHFTAAPSPLHDDLIGLIESIPQATGSIRAVRLGPRGHGKSTTLNLGLPIAAACLPERLGLRYVLVGRAKVSLAQDDVEAIRLELEGNAALNETCGDLRGPVWHKGGPLVTSTGVRIEAFGADQHVRGLRYASPSGTVRPDLVLLDDLDKDADSRAVRLGLRDWLGTAIHGLGATDRPLHVIVSGTAVSQDSFAWWLATEAPGWHAAVHRALLELPDEVGGLWQEWAAVYDADATPDRAQARAFYERRRARMDAGAVVLWPEGESLYELMMFRHVAPAGFESEKQNDPAGGRNSLISTIHAWGEPGDAFTTPPPFREIAAAVDPSMGAEGKPARGDERDYQAIVVGGVEAGGGRLVVLDADIERRTIRGFVARIVDVCIEHGVQRCRVEEVAFQGVIGRDVREAAAAAGCSTAFTPWRPPPRVSKEDRLRTLEGPVGTGGILVPRSCGLLAEQLRSLRADGTSTTKRDGPDALHMLWDLVHISGRRQPVPVQRTHEGEGRQLGDVGHRNGGIGRLLGGGDSRITAGWDR